MSTWIDGIAASSAIDTSAEILSIEGMDISSLIFSVFNWEHKSTTNPSELVGKIISVKKIFSEKDCENDRQLYYWSTIKLPFLYAMGELFDPDKPSAVEVAAMFKYDYEHKGKQAPTLGFSIEGSKLEKQGNTILNSIARKITICQSPANKTCIAEMIPAPTAKPKADIDSFFKADVAEIDLVKSKKELLKKTESENLAKMDKSAPPMPSKNKLLGQTGSGKDVFSRGPVGEYKGFGHQEHTDAASMHNKAADSAKDFKQRDFHKQKANLHTQAASRIQERGIKSAANAKLTSRTTEVKPNLGTNRKLFNPDISGKMKPPGPMQKAMTAGSANVGPSQLEGGAALAGTAKKKNWLEMAKAEYAKWPKKEAFVKFMQSKLPNMSKGAIDAIGQSLVLKKTMEAEKAMAKLGKTTDLAMSSEKKSKK